MKRASMTVTFTEETAQETHERLMTAPSVSRIDLLVWGPTLGGTTLSWFDAESDAVTHVLDAVGTVEEYHLVPAPTGTYAFVDRTGLEFDPEVLSLVADARVVFLPPLTYLDTGELRFEAVGERSRLGRFFDELSTLVSVRLDRVRPFHHRDRRTTAPITPKQRRALDAAVEAGYYDVPRTGGVADVADRLDCAHSTAGELLRRAESAVVIEFVTGRREPDRRA